MWLSIVFCMFTSGYIAEWIVSDPFQSFMLPATSVAPKKQKQARTHVWLPSWQICLAKKNIVYIYIYVYTYYAFQSNMSFKTNYDFPIFFQPCWFFLSIFSWNLHWWTPYWTQNLQGPPPFRLSRHPWRAFWRRFAARRSRQEWEKSQCLKNLKIQPIWVCLKMGYTPNYSHLVGIMIINHWV